MYSILSALYVTMKEPSNQVSLNYPAPVTEGIEKIYNFPIVNSLVRLYLG